MEYIPDKYKISRKETNKNRVIEYALKNFTENGIESSTISQIAKEVGLAERSVYRYFKNKEELVLETTFLFWEQIMEYVTSKCPQDKMEKLNGIEQIEYVLNQYANMYFLKRSELIFIHEAESYLSRSGKVFLISNKYPAPYEESNGQLAMAIKKGIEDGSVNPDLDIPIIYSNTFDSTLGLIQKFAISTKEGDTDFSTQRKRLISFCNTLVGAYRKNSY